MLWLWSEWYPRWTSVLFFFRLFGEMGFIFYGRHLFPVTKIQQQPWADAEGGPPHPPWKITKIEGFIAILVRVPWKSAKLTIQHSMLGHHRHASETPFKWRFADGPMLVSILWYLDPLSSNQLKNSLAKLDPLWQNFLDPRMATTKSRIPIFNTPSRLNYSKPCHCYGLCLACQWEKLK